MPKKAGEPVQTKPKFDRRLTADDITFLRAKVRQTFLDYHDPNSGPNWRHVPKWRNGWTPPDFEDMIDGEVGAYAPQYLLEKAMAGKKVRKGTTHALPEEK